MSLSQSLVAAKPFEHHLINRKRKNGGYKKQVGFVLMLTSMVDMFSMLVIFLLQTFSSSPEVIISNGLRLPESITSAIVKEAPVISLNKDGFLYVDQVSVGPIVKLMKTPEPMLKKLDAIKKLWMKEHPAESFPGVVNLQADKSVASTTVSKMMSVLTAGQFSTIQLAVIGTK